MYKHEQHQHWIYHDLPIEQKARFRDIERIWYSEPPSSCSEFFHESLKSAECKGCHGLRCGALYLVLEDLVLLLGRD